MDQQHMDKSDHDILIRVLVTLENIEKGLARSDSELTAYKTKTDERLSFVEGQVFSLKLSRASLIGIATGVSGVVGVIIRIFWK